MITLSNSTRLLIFDFWWIAFLIAATVPVTAFHILDILGFVSFAVVPGFLLLRAMRVPWLGAWPMLGLSVGTSVLLLMVLGVLLNSILPLVGVIRPLETVPVMSVVTIMAALLALLDWRRGGDLTIPVGRYVGFASWRGAFVAYIPAAFPLLAAFGATTLNASGTGAVTFGMLVAVAAYLCVLVRVSERTEEGVVPTGLYFVSLALLLMTSLRGDFVTGHDSQREFLVFQLAHDAGFWSMEHLRDAYNACLSITILPTMFAEALAVADLAVFKVFYQAVFAAVTPLSYLIARRYATRTTALAAALLFIAFPTFFTDMPFLNRQEIAFLFLALMTLVLFEERLARTWRRGLFLVFGAGMVLSHYSTTYIVIGLFGLVVVARPIALVLVRYARRLRWSAGSAIYACSAKPGQDAPVITWWMVAILAGMSFTWSSMLTDTSSNSLFTVLDKTATAIRTAAVDEPTPEEVSYSLISADTPSPAELLAAYDAHAANIRRAEPGAYYSEDVYERYRAVPVPEPLVPLTFIGRWLERADVDVEAMHGVVRRSSAIALQLLVMVGLVSLVFSRRGTTHPVDTDLYLLMAASFLLLVLLVVLPVLSGAYGVLRLFQQSLLFFSLAVVTGITALSWWTGKRLRPFVGPLFSILFLISSTGVITQAVGGYPPQLHLNNAGRYYDDYLMHRSDALALLWLSRELGMTPTPDFQVQAVSGFPVETSGLPGRNASVLDDIYPGLIRRNSYVFLHYSVATRGEATSGFPGTPVLFTYPMELLDTRKDLIYTNGGALIYR